MYLPVALLFTLLSVSSQLSFAAGCPDKWVSVGGQCYRYFGAHTSWKEAEKNCTDLGEAHLVSIHSKEEFDSVYQLWKQLRDDLANEGFKQRGLWIGLTDEGHEGTFTYTDESPLDYDDFYGEGEPNNMSGIEHYFVIRDVEDKEPYGNDARNDKKFQFMCKLSS